MIIIKESDPEKLEQLVKLCHSISYYDIIIIADESYNIESEFIPITHDVMCKPKTIHGSIVELKSMKITKIPDSMDQETYIDEPKVKHPKRRRFYGPNYKFHK